MKKIDVNYFKIIAYTECILGLILLSKEIASYIHLPTTHEVDAQFGGLVTWMKYKESCYKNFYIYSLIAITGLSFWLNKKLYWGLLQALLITLCFVTIINLWFLPFFVITVTFFLIVIVLAVFIYLEIKLCNKLLLNEIKISKIIICLSLLGSGFSCFIWFMLFWT